MSLLFRFTLAAVSMAWWGRVFSLSWERIKGLLSIQNLGHLRNILLVDFAPMENLMAKNYGRVCGQGWALAGCDFTRVPCLSWGVQVLWLSSVVRRTRLAPCITSTMASPRPRRWTPGQTRWSSVWPGSQSSKIRSTSVRDITATSQTHVSTVGDSYPFWGWRGAWR